MALRSRVFTGDPSHGAAFSKSQIVAFVASLRVCTRNRDLAQGTRIHDDLVQKGLLEECSDALVIMYAKCGQLGKAVALFDLYKSCNVITWTALMAAYARQGHGQHALDRFEQMRREGIRPNAVTYACALKACSMTGAGDKGKQIHDEIVTQQLLQNDIVLGGALVDMYAKCGAVSKARQVLEALPSRDVVSWSALITGYVQEGRAEQALDCFEKMQHENITPNAVTYACILKACAMIRAADKGKQIHDEIARQGLLQRDIVLGSALVDMYAKCGAVSNARQVLDGLPTRNVVPWSALIAGYVQEGYPEQALSCFEEMRREGILPDVATFTCVLRACVEIGSADRGKQIHYQIASQGLLLNNSVLGNALVDMYAKCGAVLQAQQMLEGLPSKNVSSWNGLISGYASEGHAEQALDCFEKMQREGILPDALTFASILKACATIRAANKGIRIHDEIARQGLLQNDIVLGNALVDMYAKCGIMLKARQVLDGLPSRDVVSWNTLIAGYVQEGQAEQALGCLEEMQHDGISPDAVTCACVLNVCSHRGLVEEGEALFVNMSTRYGVNPNPECCTFMVDLFGRAGHVEKALRLIQGMPSSDVNTGRWLYKWAQKRDAPVYVPRENIHATSGKGKRAKNIESTRISNRPWMKSGESLWFLIKRLYRR